AAWGLALPAVLVAFVLGLVITFKQIANPAATLAYGALYGVALGAISEAFNETDPLGRPRAHRRPRAHAGERGRRLDRRRGRPGSALGWPDRHRVQPGHH